MNTRGMSQLAPETASFKIGYEVTATTAGGEVLLYNPIRKGSVASDESVVDANDGAEASGVCGA